MLRKVNNSISNTKDSIDQTREIVKYRRMTETKRWRKAKTLNRKKSQRFQNRQKINNNEI